MAIRVFREKIQLFQHIGIFVYFCSRNETCNEHIFFRHHADTDAIGSIGGIGGEMFVYRADSVDYTCRHGMLPRRERMYDGEDDTTLGLCAFGDGTRRRAVAAVIVPAVHILQYRITDSGHPAHGVTKCRCTSGMQGEHRYCTESLIAMH